MIHGISGYALSPTRYGGKDPFNVPLFASNKFLYCACLYKYDLRKIQESFTNLGRPTNTYVNILL